MPITIDGTGSISGGSALTLGTSQSPNGVTAAQFTGIPSWAKRIIVNLDGIKTNGTNRLTLEVGTSGGYIVTGYNGAVTRFGSSGSQGAPSTTNVLLTEDNASTRFWYGSTTLTMISSTSWSITSAISTPQINTGNCVSAATVNFTGALDRLRITSVGAIDLFNAGTINILYE